MPSSTPPSKGKYYLLFHLLHRRRWPLFAAYSNAATSPPDSYTVEFLTNNCGIPMATARSATRYLRIDESAVESPLAVLSLLRSHGLSPSHIGRIVAQRPIILNCRADRTLAPKLRYLSSLLPPSHLSDLLVANPTLLSRSLKAHIEPLFDLLRCFLDSPDALLQVTRRNRHILTCNIAATVSPNIALLFSRGVPAENITKLLATHPRSLTRPTAIFAEAVETVSDLGLDPGISLFIHAIRAMNCMRRSTLEAKIEFFRRLGWSEEEFRFAFQRAPLFVLVSNHKLQKMVEFWMEEVRLKTSDLSRQPKLLMYSLENRLLPRFQVYRLLEAEGLLKQRGERMRIRLVTGMFTCSEEVFMDRYVLRYSEVVPDLASMYSPQVGLVNDSSKENICDGVGLSATTKKTKEFVLLMLPQC